MSSDEIKTLQKQNEPIKVEITQTISVAKFAYLCDTTIEIFESNTLKYLLESENPIPIIMIECTYFTSDMEIEAHTRKHICWTQLKPITMKYSKTMFILFHYSLRYDCINKIIELTSDKPENVFLWI
jgi:ribonuclease Z